MFYYVFDVLILGGRAVMSKPLSERRDLLRKHVFPKLNDPIRQSPELHASLPELDDALTAPNAGDRTGKKSSRVAPP